MRFKSTLLILAALMLCSCMNAVSQQDLQAVYSRVNHNEEQIRQLNSQVGLEGSVVPGQAQMWSQMQSMRQDINMIRGQLEDMNMNRSANVDAQRLESRIDQLEGTLRQMASELAIDLETLGPGAADMGMQIDGGMNAAEHPEAVPQNVPGVETGTAAGAPATMAPLTTPSTPATAQPPAAATQPGATSAQAAPVTAPPLAADNNLAQSLYNSGTKAFSDRKYADAVKIFNDFVKTFPSHRLTSNSFFWLGESYYQMKNYSAAIVAYQQVIEKFPGSTKLQSAMFKQGVSMYYNGQNAAGKIRLQDLIKKYPKSAEADRAKQFMEKNP